MHEAHRVTLARTRYLGDDALSCPLDRAWGPSRWRWRRRLVEQRRRGSWLDRRQRLGSWLEGWRRRVTYGTDLTVVGGFSQGNVGAKQGAATLVVTDGGGLSGSQSDFDTQAGTSITYGGWVTIQAYNADTNLINRRDLSAGYLAWVENGRPKCTGNGQSGQTTGPVGAVPLNTWVHFLCRYDAAAVTVAVILNGSAVSTSDAVPIAPSGLPFRIGKGFEGALDEIFFTKALLSDTAVRRIYACGIDGAMCECDPDEPAKYTDCGRRHPDCDATLPPCDQATP